MRYFVENNDNLLTSSQINPSVYVDGNHIYINNINNIRINIGYSKEIIRHENDVDFNYYPNEQMAQEAQEAQFAIPAQVEYPQFEYPVTPYYARNSEPRNTLYHLNNIIYPSKLSIHRLHFFGDIYAFDAHWIEQREILDFICRLNKVPKNDFSARIKSESESEQDSSFKFYTCSLKYFKGSINEKEFLDRIEGHKNIEEDREGWNTVPYKNKCNKWKLIEEKFSRETNIYCLGCVIKKPIHKMYLLSAINVENNQIVYFTVNKFFLEDIMNEYNKNKRDYEHIEQFFYDHDFEISRIEANKRFRINYEKTKYKGLREAIYLLNPEFIVDSKIVREAKSYNNYCGNVYLNTIQERHTCPVNICNIRDNQITFRRANEEKNLRVIQLLPNQINKIGGGRRIGGAGRMIEI